MFLLERRLEVKNSSKKRKLRVLEEKIVVETQKPTSQGKILAGQQLAIQIFGRRKE
jgi:ubiquitin